MRWSLFLVPLPLLLATLIGPSFIVGQVQGKKQHLDYPVRIATLRTHENDDFVTKRRSINNSRLVAPSSSTNQATTKLLLLVRGGGSSSHSGGSNRRSLPERVFTFVSRRSRQSKAQKEKERHQQLEKCSQLQNITSRQQYNPLLFYRRCMGIVLLWVSAGTLFYSYYNRWPLPQSFFYAVDAGMSIGFCTDVFETKLFSKAFTILYILLGSSVIGGALALFIQDMVEGLAKSSSSSCVHEYQVLLEREVFDQADVGRTGVLTFVEFERLIRSSSNAGNRGKGQEEPITEISADDIQFLWTKFDRLKDGVIHFEEFTGTFRGIDRLIQALQKHQALANRPVRRILWQMNRKLQQAWQIENRIYFVFAVWISTGILWGMIDQGWDAITATHFAVSALATGGLTAPAVNAQGILPARPAIFCGIYCLLGIPLFALTLGNFARVLVSGQVEALEREALTRPMNEQEFDLASHLTTHDDVVHLSDFIVLQLLRQGKLSPEAVQVLKENFEMLDSDRSGTLTLGQATAARPVPAK